MQNANYAVEYSELKLKKDKKQYLQELVSSNRRAAEAAIIRLYNKQTESEKNESETIVYNGVGFTSVDAKILSSFARQILNGRTLSDKQAKIAFAKLPKYWKQLMKMADEKCA